MADFLNKNKKQIGAEGEWRFASPGVKPAFQQSGSAYRDASINLEKLLSIKDNNIRVMVFAVSTQNTFS